jgi:choline dehydrogenase-like flavoprotein
VEYIDPSGEKKFQKGKIVILACNAIESARLCLLSANGKHPGGLGNSSGLVGKNLTFHTMVTAGGLFPERMHSHRGRQTVMLIDDFNPSPFRVPLPGAFSTLMGGSTEIAGGLQPIEEATYLPLVGEMHKLFMKLSVAREHAGAMTVFVKDLPQLTNYIDLDPQVKDIYGFPVARITYKLHKNDRRSAEFFTTKLKEIMDEAGALLTFIDINNEQLGNGIPSSKHLHGTLRMGNDPSESVVDKWGKFHDLDNLYCVDGSIFVHSTGYNPALTIMALSFMICAHIVKPEDPWSIIPDVI